jgi:hypothetical protein
MAESPPPPPTNDVPFESLTTSVWGGRCIAVIGAGLSAADYPVWPSLIGILQERCGVKSEDSLSTDPLDLAQAAKDKNASKYYKALDKTFDRRKNPTSATRYHLLARTPFASYVNLNFDPLLLDVLGLHKNLTVSEYPHLQNQQHGRGELFYMHGRLGPDRPAESTPIVLTRSEFERAYDPYQTRLHSFIQTTMLDNDVCFLGCNPAEPHLARLVAICKKCCDADHGLTDPKRPRWFLLADGEFQTQPSLAGSGIHVVHYDRLDAKFSGMDAVLE